MTQLLKFLVILLQNPQRLSLSKYVQTLNFNLDPPIFPTRSQRVLLDLATAKTLTNQIHRFGSWSHRDWPCQLSVALLQLFQPHRIAIGTTETAWQLFVALLLRFGPTELLQSVPPRRGFSLAIAHWFIRVVSVGPTKIPNIHIFTQISATEFSDRCQRDGSKVCNGWIL